MHWYVKDLSKVGFKGSNIFQSNWHHFYFRAVPERKAVYILDALEERVQHFELTAEEWKKFKKGTLSLVPVGCCDAGCSHQSKEDPIVDFVGDTKKIFKTKKKFLDYLDNLCEGYQECPSCDGGFTGDDWHKHCCRVCEGTNRIKTSTE